MSFTNLVLGLEPDLVLLGGTPAFRVFHIKDQNSLSGVTKKNRRLEAPNDPMRIIHGRFLRYLRTLSVDLSYATACRSGDSPRKNVEWHRRSRFFFILDLRHAYQSVEMGRLARVLCGADLRLVGMESEAEQFLKQYCVSQIGGLATGAPASPDLFNIYCAVLLDASLGKFCAKVGATYTRYLDDLTFSGNVPISKSVRRNIRQIVEEAGFEVNHKKARILDLAKGALLINGVGLELGGRIFAPGFFTRRVTGLLVAAQKDSVLRPRAEGAIGQFLALTDRHNPNKTEAKVLRQYQRLRRHVRDEKRRAKASTR